MIPFLYSWVYMCWLGVCLVVIIHTYLFYWLVNFFLLNLKVSLLFGLVGNGFLLPFDSKLFFFTRFTTISLSLKSPLEVEVCSWVKVSLLLLLLRWRPFLWRWNAIMLDCGFYYENKVLNFYSFRGERQVSRFVW